MGLTYRKSIKAGPFRFNLSGSGVGVSVGAPGFRIGRGPRGNYVSISKGGFTYRASLPSQPRVGRSPNNKLDHQPAEPVSKINDHVGSFRSVESVDVQVLADSSADALLEELQTKASMLPIWPWPLVLVAMAWAILGGIGNTPMTLLLLLSTGGTWWLRQWDKSRRTTVLLYDIDAAGEGNYAEVLSAFKELDASNRVWKITTQGRVTDGRYHAGASHLIRRINASLGTGQAPNLSSNLDFPYFKAGKITIYAAPDRLFVFGQRTVATLPYRLLNLDARSTRFIESDTVPHDAKVIDHTWRYVNKDGSPYRRFNNNHRIPVVAYDELHFTSRTGLEELFQFSRQGVAGRFKGAISQLSGADRSSASAQAVSPLPDVSSPSSPVNRRLLATVIILCILMVGIAALQSVLGKHEMKDADITPSPSGATQPVADTKTQSSDVAAPASPQQIMPTEIPPQAPQPVIAPPPIEQAAALPASTPPTPSAVESALVPCQNDGTYFGQAICKSTALSQEYERMAQEYQAAQSRIGGDDVGLRIEQERWFLNAKKVCNNDSCLLQTLASRSAELASRYRK